jgi:CubicO group peptidase (beta-lactamase class C family)
MKRMLFAMAASLVVVAPSVAQDADQFDRVVQPYVANKQFMGSVLVARGPAVVFARGYGSANLEWSIPNDATTKFRLGSLTKQFTAASILLLEERGKLNVEDRVTKYLPDAPAAWGPITIRHLLTHTSGLPNFTAFADYRSLASLPTTPDALVARFRDKPLDFQPGEKFSYSNSGYALLGYLIEKVTGGSYEAFLLQNIFAPLGMKDSGYDSNTAIIPRRASGYVPGAPAPLNAGFVHMTIPFAAGALYSTTEDLLRWEQGLFGGKVLSPESLRKMTTPFKNDYAFGVSVRTTAQRTVVEHNGGIDGFNTYLAYYPDSKTTVVVLGNLNGPAPDQIGPKLGAAAHGDAIQSTARKEITLPAATLARYVGTYELVAGVTLMITVDGGQMMGQLTGQGKLALFPESETFFFLKVVDAQVEFFKDDAGTVTHLVLHQNGRDQKATRKSATVETHPERVAIAVAPAILIAYPGTYDVQFGFAIVITLEGDQLMLQATGQPKFPLFAETETRFFLRVVDAQVDFTRNGQGPVTGMVLHQGGRDIPGTKQ